jgi:WD40 repeat protein
VSSRLKGKLLPPNRTGLLHKLKISPDGKRLLAHDSGGVLVLWDLASGKRLTTIKARNYLLTPDWRTVYTVHGQQHYERVERDGKRMYRCTFDSEVRSWNLEDGKLIRTYKHQPSRGIRSIELSPDGSRLLTSEELPGVYEGASKFATTLWDVKSGKSQSKHDFGLFLSDSRSLICYATGENNFTRALKSIDVQTGRENWSHPYKDARYHVFVQKIAHDGRLIFGSVRRYDRADIRYGWRNWLKWWDAATGREVASFEGDQKDGFTGLCLSPDERTLAVLNWRSEKRKLFLYEVAERRLLRTTILGEKPQGHKLLATGSTFSPDGKWFVVITRQVPEKARGRELDPRDLPQPRILLIETATGAIHETIICPPCLCNDVCFSPDGRTLATGGPGCVLLWDMTKMPALTMRERNR